MSPIRITESEDGETTVVSTEKAHYNFFNASGQYVDIRIVQSDLNHEYVILTVDENSQDRFASILFSRIDFSQVVERLNEI